MSVNARIINITRGSLHDGQGVRTVVYLKGCNMHCQWCHNPESTSFQPQILLAESKCIHCCGCFQICPEHHTLENDRHIYIKEGCTACGQCAKNCPVNALQLCGEQKSPQDILQEVLKDKHYYDASSGGVTFSGGECLLHVDFMKEMVRLCKDADISVTVQSAMNIPWDNVEPLVGFVDCFYVDIKHMDSQQHQKYTGCDNQLILNNIRHLATIHDSILIRTPLIPGVNDSLENLIRTAEFAKSCGTCVKGLELLRYNILGKSKYSLLQQEYKPFAEETQSADYMKDLCQKANRAINETDFVFWVQ